MSENIKQFDDPVDQDLDYARRKRIAIINDLTKDGVPKDKQSLSLLITALNDMDRTSISKKKVKVENDMVAINKQAADIIATIYSKPNSKTIGFTTEVRGTIPKVDGLLPEVTLLEGEMDSGSVQLDYETFMKKIDG